MGTEPFGDPAQTILKLVTCLFKARLEYCYLHFYFYIWAFTSALQIGNYFEYVPRQNFIVHVYRGAKRCSWLCIRPLVFTYGVYLVAQALIKLSTWIRSSLSSIRMKLTTGLSGYVLDIQGLWWNSVQVCLNNGLPGYILAAYANGQNKKKKSYKKW